MPETKKTDKELLLDEIKGLIADSQKEGVSKTDLDAKVEVINKTIAEKLDNAEMKALKESVDNLMKATSDNAAAIKAMVEAPNAKSEKPMTFKEALIAAVQESAKNIPTLLTEKNDDLGKRQSLKDYFQRLGNKTTPEMTVKIAVDMLESSIVQSNVATVRLTDLDANRVGTPLTIYPHVVDWMPVKGITKKYMSILVVYTYVDGSGTKTEGTASAQSSFLFKTVEFVAATIATYFTLSDETLDDLPEAMDEISIVGPDKIKDNIDSQILGSAGDDTATIKGLYAASKRTLFDGTVAPYGASVDGKATIVDVIAAMKHKCEAGKYMPDTVILNTFDVLQLASAKDQLDNSRYDRRVVFNALGEPSAVCGLVIRKNVTQTVNTMAVLANNMLQIGDRKNMTLEIGYNGTDFTEGQKTVVIKTRLAFAVRDAAAVIYCSDIATAISDITIV